MNSAQEVTREILYPDFAGVGKAGLRSGVTALPAAAAVSGLLLALNPTSAKSLLQGHSTSKSKALKGLAVHGGAVLLVHSLLGALKELAEQRSNSLSTQEPITLPREIFSKEASLRNTGTPRHPKLKKVKIKKHQTHDGGHYQDYRATRRALAILKTLR